MDVHKALLAVSECMFEAVGVLQRDAPLVDDTLSDNKGMEAYRQLADRYTTMLNERISQAQRAIEGIECRGERMQEKMERVQQAIPEQCARLELELQRRLELNFARHAGLAGLFEELVNGRFAPDR